MEKNKLKKIRFLLGTIKRFFLMKIFKKQQVIENYYLMKWYKEKNDFFRLSNIKLKPQSLIYDVGAFRGDFTLKNFSENSKYFLFEPVKKYYNECIFNVSKYSNISVFNFGLDDQTITKSISIGGASSSTERLIEEYSKPEIINLKSLKQIMSELKHDKIELIKINTEGSEYRILDHMINYNLQDKFKMILVQFHVVDKFSLKKMNGIIEKLKKTHKIDFHYPFVWTQLSLK